MSQFLITEQSVCCVPWDDAGAFLRFSVTYLGTDEAEEEWCARLREKDALEVMPERCRSCAYRGGTIPNGCPNTVRDALKCAMEGVPFYCHQTPPNVNGGHTGLCGGYLISRSTLYGREPVSTPWPFSDERESCDPAHGPPC